MRFWSFELRTTRGSSLGESIGRFSQKVSEWTGSSLAFFTALSIILIWGLTGPLFHYSDSWQLVINTGTTIITFLMVFLIQRAQNKDALAIQLKLNELVAAMKGASNRLIDVEDLSEQELKLLHEHYRRLVEMAKNEHNLTKSHSVEEAERRHITKREEAHPARRDPAKDSNKGSAGK